jgi:hypothetical protein
VRGWALAFVLFLASTAHLEGRPALVFAENCGQWRTGAPFVAWRKGEVVAFEQDAVLFRLERCEKDCARGVRVRFTFEGASEACSLEGEEALPGTYNFFFGNDPRRWRSDVPGHARVVYREIYQGIDARFRTDAGRLEYDLVLAPGADLSRFVVRIEGAEGFEIDPDGSLVVETPVGELRQRPPRTWESLPAGGRRPADCRFRKIDDFRYGFDAPGRDAELPLVIDPDLVWSTYLGGFDEEWVTGVTVDRAGTVTVCGLTSSTDFDFPATIGAYEVVYGGGAYDGFVTRLEADGSGLIFSTFLGGSGRDEAVALALDSGGGVYLAGSTDSPDFPTTPGAFKAVPGGMDGFLAHLGPEGNAIAYSTVFGGSSDDAAVSLAVDGSGAVTFAGPTTSSDFPTTEGAFQRAFHGGVSDYFVTRLRPDPALRPAEQLYYSTLLGGSGQDGIKDNDADLRMGGGLAVDANGGIFVAASTNSADFPITPGAFGPTIHGPRDLSYASFDAFVAQLRPDLTGGEQLAYSTFLGGGQLDRLLGLGLDPSGAVIVAGAVRGGDGFPTTAGAYDRSFNSPSGFSDVFIARVKPGGPGEDQLLYSSFFGGSGDDIAWDVAVDASGEVVLVGQTRPSDYPYTEGAYDTTFNGGERDGILVRLNPDPALLPEEQLQYSTLFGASIEDRIIAAALDPRGGVVVAGNTTSLDFPTTTGAFDRTYNGGLYDGFVARFDLPFPHAAFTLTPETGGAPLEVEVDASASVTPETTAIGSYQWEFGDGSAGSGKVLRHVFTGPGRYAMTLTVTNDRGRSGKARKSIFVGLEKGDVSPWASSDIGSPRVPGGARLEGGCLAVFGSGKDIGGSQDEFQFVRQELKGDGSIVARVTELSALRADARVGVMLRESLDPRAAHASMVVGSPAGGAAAFLNRAHAGGSTAVRAGPRLEFPRAWLRVERKGNVLTGSASTDGAAWTEVGQVTGDFPETVYAGIAATGKDQGNFEWILAKVCDATVVTGAPAAFRRGDLSGDDGVNITDPVLLLRYLFLAGEKPPCLDAADADDSGLLDLADPVYLLDYQFLGGPEPPAPGPAACGPDPSTDDLPCESTARCG